MSKYILKCHFLISFSKKNPILLLYCRIEWLTSVNRSNEDAVAKRRIFQASTRTSLGQVYKTNDTGYKNTVAYKFVERYDSHDCHESLDHTLGIRTDDMLNALYFEYT